MPMRGNWSDLNPDLLLLVFELLSLIDFCRAKSVCSAWYSASRFCPFKQESFPWLILFPEKTENYNCLLFNPEEDKAYGVRDLGTDFDQSRCIASHGSWFLLLNLRADFYIMNPLTRERINLPSIECFDGQIKIDRGENSEFLLTLPASRHSEKIPADYLSRRFTKAVLWTDGRTRDYLAVLVFNSRNIAFCRKGDDRWREFCNSTPESHERIVVYKDMAYRNGKLYVMRCISPFTSYIVIWDFGRSFPVETTRIRIEREDFELASAKMAITLSGDILLAVHSSSSSLQLGRLPNILVLKFDPGKTKWENVDTLGDEALNLDQQITVPAKDVKRIKRDSIYFNYEDSYFRFYDGVFVGIKSKIGVFNLGTGMVKQFKHEEYLQEHLRGGKFRDAHWFFPGIGKMVQSQPSDGKSEGAKEKADNLKGKKGALKVYVRNAKRSTCKF